MAKQAIENATRLNAFAMDANDITIIGLDTKDGPEHPLYDKRIHLPVERSMVLNIKVHGVLETVIVRKMGDKIETVDGRQRVRAARVASEELVKEGMEPIRVPVMVRKGEESELLGVMISANEIRRGDNPIAKARKAARYIALGHNEKEASVHFGVTAQTIGSWLKILEADKSVVAAVEAGRIGMTLADRIARMPREEQAAELERVIAAGITVAEKDRETRVKRSGTGDSSTEEPEHKRPSVQTSRKLLKGIEDGKVKGDAFDDAAIAMLRWCAGQAGPRSVKGLTAALRAIGEGEEGE